MSQSHLASPLTLRCGLVLPNRLVKAAMAEDMADQVSLPGPEFQKCYNTWAHGGWGMIITGNVQIDPRFLGQSHDVTFNKNVSYADTLAAWTSWAEACNNSNNGGTPTIVQINHPGRQSPIGSGTRGYCEKNVAPSPINMNFGDGIVPRAISALVFGTPREMTVLEIREVINDFASTAKMAASAGFAGVEIHAAHGYLLAQFLSNMSNKRTDEYGGSPEARAKMIVEIIAAIRAEAPKGFCVGIKLNSADHQSGSQLEDCLRQLRCFTKAGVDFIEVSGGTYENPTMMLGTEQSETTSARTTEREAFFLQFAKKVRKELPDVPLMVTGGFRSRRFMESTIANGDCDLIGIGRPAVLNPSLPNDILLNKNVEDDEAKVLANKIRPSWFYRMIPVKSIGAGTETMWYSGRIRMLGV